jgi:hypothetical protein
VSIDEDLQVLDAKIKQLKLDYDQYFLGSRPREPAQLRAEVSKLVTLYSNTAIQNTAARFKFQTLCSRFFVFRRQWDEALRQIEAGTYTRHLFKAKLHEVERGVQRGGLAGRAGGRPGDSGGPDLFEAYLAACRECGQEGSGMTRDKLDALLARQREQLQARFACEDVRFRVVVENGKPRLKATPVGARKGA